MKYTGLFLMVALCAVNGSVSAQGGAQSSKPWEKYSERIKASEAVAPLGEDLFGDRVSLSNGALSFAVTDVQIPGNGTLPVALEREYVLSDRRWLQSVGMFADWDVSVPRLTGTFNPDWVVQPAHGQPTTAARCSTRGTPATWFPFEKDDFWSGVNLSLLDGDKGTILSANTAVTLQDGVSYPWITGDGKVRLACLQAIQNGAGEGFLAITPDGTRYWFDWMGQTIGRPLSEKLPTPGEPEMLPNGVRIELQLDYYMSLRQNTLYVTRIEDRFGNNVVLTYSNAWNAPGKLTRIESSDGRIINLTYTGNYVSAVSDGSRTWNYAYASTSSGRNTLTEVTRPDGSRWLVNFQGFTNDGEIKYRDYTPVGEVMRNCLHISDPPLNAASTFIGSITHPSGAVGTFEANLQEHGRSNVPIGCKNVTSVVGTTLGSANDPSNDVNLWATRGYSFTLTRKSITGPGLTPAAWNYSYAPGFSIYRYPGTTVQYPVCDWDNYLCGLPPCLSDSCAGSSQTTVTGPDSEWSRYTYGNSFLYNEGKLLKVEQGTSESNILRVQNNTYDLSLRDSVYPASFGRALSGNSFQSEFHRPLISTETIQEGVVFKTINEQFDAWANPTKVFRASRSATP